MVKMPLVFKSHKAGQPRSARIPTFFDYHIFDANRRIISSSTSSCCGYVMNGMTGNFPLSARRGSCVWQKGVDVE